MADAEWPEALEDLGEVETSDDNTGQWVVVSNDNEIITVVSPGPYKVGTRFTLTKGTEAEIRAFITGLGQNPADWMGA
jgi:hypothetical protein